ncbi:MAG: leucine-rich repeat domain-containing protein [Treponema sp.]|nr:leucine-rich repeat domain-containing protein [Treponema sp.]
MNKKSYFVAVLLSLYSILFLSLFSCSFQGVKDASSEKKTEASQFVSVKVKADICHSRGSTVNPSSFTEEDISALVLKIYKKDAAGSGNTSGTDGSSSSDNCIEKRWEKSLKDGLTKTAISAMEEDSFFLERGYYDFILLIYGEGSDSEEVLLQADQSKKNVHIFNNEESLEFSTVWITSCGDLSLTFQWQADEYGKNKIGKIQAGLFSKSNLNSALTYTIFNEDGDSLDVSCDYEFLTINTSEEDGQETWQANYSRLKLPDGEYFLKYRLWNKEQTAVLNTFLDLVKIQSYKTERVIEINSEKINKLPKTNGTFSIDSKIEISAEAEGDLYLNTGKIRLNAYIKELGPDKGKIDTSNWSARLFYCGAELSEDYFHFMDDGFVLIGAPSKLITSGTYQLYVTVLDPESQTRASASFDIFVPEKEYYNIYVDDTRIDSSDWYFYGFKDFINSLSAPCIVKVEGEGKNTKTDESITGTLKTISSAIQYNVTYPVDLDLSELQGVTEIKNGDINALSISSIILPESLEVIEEKGFYMDPVNRDGETYYTKLQEIKIGKNVSEIQEKAFYKCSALNEIIIDTENDIFSTKMGNRMLVAKSDDGAGGQTETLLYGCGGVSGFGSLDFSDEEFSGVKRIAANAFENAKINKISSFGNITSIGNSAFESATIEEISSFGNVTSLENSAFMYAQIDSMTLDKLIVPGDEVYPFYYANVKNLTVDFEFNNTTDSADAGTPGEGKTGFEKFEKMIVPLVSGYRNGVSNVENLVFNQYAYFPASSTSEPRSYDTYPTASIFYSSCGSLKSIKFNEGAYVGKYRFIGMEKLESIVFGQPDEGKDSVVEGCVFSGYYNDNNTLAELDLTGVKSLDYRAFYNCTALEEVTLPASLGDALSTGTPEVPVYGNFDRGSFEGCTHLKTFSIEEGNSHYKVGGNGKYVTTFDGETLIAGVYADIGNLDFRGTGIKTISQNVFFNRGSSITGINLGEVESVGSQAFDSSCAYLTSFDLGTSLNYLDTYAFKGCCASFEDPVVVKLPDSLTALEMSSTSFQNANLSFKFTGSDGQPSEATDRRWFCLSGEVGNTDHGSLSDVYQYLLGLTDADAIKNALGLENSGTLYDNCIHEVLADNSDPENPKSKAKVLTEMFLSDSISFFYVTSGN